MGIYTEHWEQYKRRNVRDTLWALVLIVLGFPAIAFLGYLLSPLDNVRMAVLGGAIVLFLGVFTSRMLRASKVSCPRCQTRYSRGRSLVDCPKCSLRMLQEDP
jgi:hypothetical protein